MKQHKITGKSMFKHRTKVELSNSLVACEISFSSIASSLGYFSSCNRRNNRFLYKIIVIRDTPLENLSNKITLHRRNPATRFVNESTEFVQRPDQAEKLD